MHTSESTDNKESFIQQSKYADKTARKYVGGIGNPTLALLLASYVGFAGSIFLFGFDIISPFLATLLVAVFTYFSYTPLHEAVHSNIHGGNENFRWLNDACGYLGGQLIAVSYRSHRLEHFAHHRHTNVVNKDPDIIISSFAKGPLHALFAALGFLGLQNSYLAKNYWKKVSNRERAIYCLEIITLIGWRVLLIVCLIAFFATGLLETLTVILGGYYIGAFFTVYWFAYRPHHPYNKQKRFENTASLIMPRWLRFIEWFWLGQNLHSIHHLYPRVPFYRYRALHNEIEPTLRSHQTPIIGIYSRRPL